MGYNFRFAKILSLKESEKDKALSEYNEALKKFEQVAERLYHSLKQKEDLEEIHKKKLQSGLSIDEIRHYQVFLGNLERTIHHYQQIVIQARGQLELKQAKLAELNIEVKKYEKMKEKYNLAYLQAVKSEENKFIDEISIQQYVNRGK